MNLISGRNTPAFTKDTVYRFMKMLQINWIRFTTILSARIMKEAIVPLNAEDRVNVLLIDDFMFERNRPKKTELLAKWSMSAIEIRETNTFVSFLQMQT